MRVLRYSAQLRLMIASSFLARTISRSSRYMRRIFLQRETARSRVCVCMCGTALQSIESRGHEPAAARRLSPVR